MNELKTVNRFQFSEDFYVLFKVWAMYMPQLHLITFMHHTLLCRVFIFSLHDPPVRDMSYFMAPCCCKERLINGVTLQCLSFHPHFFLHLQRKNHFCFFWHVWMFRDILSCCCSCNFVSKHPCWPSWEATACHWNQRLLMCEFTMARVTKICFEQLKT